MPCRVRAAMLAILFLAGSLGVSVADALMFHQVGNHPFAVVVHVEGVDTDCHAERCLLSQATRAPREALGIPLGIQIALPLFVDPTPRRGSEPVTALLVALERSRAPPA